MRQMMQERLKMSVEPNNPDEQLQSMNSMDFTNTQGLRHKPSDPELYPDPSPYFPQHK